jgi:hypothetical protein
VQRLEHAEADDKLDDRRGLDFVHESRFSTRPIPRR